MKLPRFTATTTPPRLSGLARATDIAGLTQTGEIAKLRGLGAFGRGMERAGEYLFKAQQERQALDDEIESGKATQMVLDQARLAENTAQAYDASLDQPLPDSPDFLKTITTFDTIKRDKLAEKARKTFLKDTNTIFSGIKNPRVKAKLENWRNARAGQLFDATRRTYGEKLQDYQETEMNKLRIAAAENGDMEVANHYVELMDKHKLITHKQAEALKNDNNVIIKKSAIENIKPDLITAISIRGNAKDGYKVLDAVTAQLVKEGILTEPEAAEANKKLGDWIDNYVAGRIKAAKDADKLTTIQSYREMSRPILNGELTYDDIENSNLRQTRRSGESVSDAERWHQYIKGSYKDAPTKNAPEGHTVSFAAVYDAATLQLSPKEAYDVLLESRFVNQSITNEQFEWAVDKIENPYSKHVLEDLKGVLKSNLEDFNRLFSFDNERNKKVNEALISWVDDLIKQNKVPSKKEMAAMSSAFRVGDGQPYDIGRVIERGGREWEIIGFDDNGEPLVEEIP